MDAIASSSTFVLGPYLFPARTVASATTISTRPLSSCQLASAANTLSFRCRRQTRRLCAGAASRSTIRCDVIKEIGESEFSSVVLASDRPVLVEFVATWCGPCRLVYRAVESLAQEYGDRLTVVKIDHDANPRLIEEYKVYGLPSFILFKNGQEVPGSKREGAITELKLREYIDNLLKTISVA